MSEKKVQVAWLNGGYHSRRSMLRKIKDKFKDSQLLQSDSSYSFEYLSTQMQMTGCFDESKLVVINEMPEFKDGQRQKCIKLFKEVLSELDDSIFVVFNGIPATKEKALFAHVQSIGRVYDYPEVLAKKEAPSWVSDRLQKRGFSVDYKAAEALVETCGHDRSLDGVGIDLLEMAMERIVRYSGDQKQVTTEVVEATMVRHENFIIWDILNAVDARQYDRCVNLLSKVDLLDDNVIQGVSQLMNTLLRHFRLLLILKDSALSLKEPKKIAAAVGEMRKLKRISEGTGFSAVYGPELYATGDNEGKPQPVWTKNIIDGAMNGFYGREPSVNLYTRRDVYRIIRAVQNATMHLRGIQSESLALLLADTVFMVACNVADDQQIKIIMDSFEKIQI